MSHPEDEALVAAAMGEGTPETTAHVAACGRCAAEVRAFAVLTDRLPESAPAGLTAPPARVWDAIAASVAADRDDAIASAPAPAPASPSASAPADELAARRQRRTGPRWWALGAAAAAGVVIGGVGVAALGGSDEAVREVVASADLTDLATESAAGSAEVEVLDDGERVLVVDTSDFEQPDDAYLEVWLIDEQIDGMVSLGHLTGGRTEFTLPEGVDIAQFPIVDISVEPVDGIPTHSGDSVTRGVLGA